MDAVLPKTLKPSFIVKYLDQYVDRPGRRQEDPGGRRLFALPEDRARAARTHIADRQEQRAADRLRPAPARRCCAKRCRNVLDVPFVTADATSLAQTRYVNEEIEAILQRLVDKADGNIARGAERHRLHRRDRQAQGDRRRAARQLRRKRPARAAEDHGRLAGQARQQRSTSTRPTSCSSAAARSSASRRSCRRRTATASFRRRRATTRASSIG